MLYNGFTDEGAKRLLNAIKAYENRNIYKLEMSEKISKEKLTELKALLKKNVPKKGRKKKKKKAWETKIIDIYFYFTIW